MKKKFTIVLAIMLALILTTIGTYNVNSAQAAEDDKFVIGTGNLNGTVENSAKVGDVLKSPEKGWKRYQETNSNILYLPNGVGTSHDNGKWKKEVFSYHSGGSANWSKGGTAEDGSQRKLKFKFYGSKIRIIAYVDNVINNRPTNAIINIDGIEYPELNYEAKTNTWQVVVYEKTDLELKEHTVEMYCSVPTDHYNIDAIDIDEDGELRPYDVHAESISLDKTSLNMIEGSSEKLTATVLPDNATNKKVVWTSSNNDIAKVDENGNITAVKEGQATIMAKVEGTELTDTCVVNVTKAQLPEETGNAILSISLVNGSTKQYDVSMEEVNKFIQWYETRTKGEGTNIYAFSKSENPYKEIKEYIAQDKIASFEVKEYVSVN